MLQLHMYKILIGVTFMVISRKIIFLVLMLFACMVNAATFTPEISGGCGFRWTEKLSNGGTKFIYGCVAPEQQVPIGTVKIFGNVDDGRNSGEIIINDPNGRDIYLFICVNGAWSRDGKMVHRTIHSCRTGDVCICKIL